MLALPSQAGPSRLPAKLPFFLDFSCPVALPSRSIGGTPWPFEHCGPASHEPPIVFLRRRYLETLFLSDVSHLIQLQNAADGSLYCRYQTS